MAQFLRSTAQVGLDFGLPFGRLGELRAGFLHLTTSTTPTLLSAAVDGHRASAQIWQEDGLRVRGVVDQLDFVNFPTSGYRLEGRRRGGQAHAWMQSEHMARGSVEGTRGADSLGRHTFELHGALKMSDRELARSVVDQFTLGGFQQLSGYRPDQLSGNAVLFGRLNWYTRLTDHAGLRPRLLPGRDAGGRQRLGQARGARCLRNLRGGGSVYLGADTGIGPMYLGITYAPRGELGIALFIGRP